jgi:hypothetical protein
MLSSLACVRGWNGCQKAKKCTIINSRSEIVFEVEGLCGNDGLWLIRQLWYNGRRGRRGWV